MYKIYFSLDIIVVLDDTTIKIGCMVGLCLGNKQKMRNVSTESCDDKMDGYACVFDDKLGLK